LVSGIRTQTTTATTVENPYRKYGPLGEDCKNKGAVKVTMKFTTQLATSSTAQTFARSLVGIISDA
jgi:hypothetical protein